MNDENPPAPEAPLDGPDPADFPPIMQASDRALVESDVVLSIAIDAVAASVAPIPLIPPIHSLIHTLWITWKHPFTQRYLVDAAFRPVCCTRLAAE